MPGFLIEFHSIFRWVVLLAAVGAIALAVMAATGSRPWDALSDRLSLGFTVAMDVQFLIGIVLWLIEGRWGAPDVYLTWFHPLLMVGAVALAHIGRARADRAQGDKAQGTAAAIFFGTSLLLVLAAIPLNSWPL